MGNKKIVTILSHSKKDGMVSACEVNIGSKIFVTTKSHEIICVQFFGETQILAHWNIDYTSNRNRICLNWAMPVASGSDSS